MAENLIKKIKVGNIDYSIEATTLGGHSYEELVGMVQGVVGTYVISMKQINIPGYDNVVHSEDNIVTVNYNILNNLIPSDKDIIFKIGDIILMEESSDGTKVFDRWVSEINGDVITLAVLETQVATHHHELSVTESSAITKIEEPTKTTFTVAKVGNPVSVVTNIEGTIVTDVSYDEDGVNNMAIVSVTSDYTGAVGHTHTVSSHNHTINIGHDDLVDTSVSAYTSLVSEKHTLHTHGDAVIVAGSTNNEEESINIVTSGTSASFITKLEYDNINTSDNTVGLITGLSEELETSDQTSEDEIGDKVLTLESGSHTHELNAVTDSVITDGSVADEVVTNIDITNNTLVADEVVTSITTVSTSVVTTASLGGNTTFITNISMSVDQDGILSFGFDTGSVTISTSTEDINTITSVTSASQSTAAPTLSVSTSKQSLTKGSASVIGTITSAGSHNHGFSHTHTIAGHTHTIASHSHTYEKCIVNDSCYDYAINTLSSTSYTLHTHEDDVTVAGSINTSNTINIVTDGSTTDVIESLVSSKSLTSTSSDVNIDDAYYALEGDIKCPSLRVSTNSISDMIDTDSINPAVDSNEQVITSISFETGKFIDSIGLKTGTNIGGNGN